MKYVYLAKMTMEDNAYLVRFPDIEEISTFGSDLYEALEMAEDALNLALMDMEDSNELIPAASDIRKVKVDEDNAFVTLIKADTDSYRKLLADMKNRGEL